MDIGKDFSGCEGELWRQTVGRFSKGLGKLRDKKPVEGLLEGLVRDVAAGVCLGNGLQRAARLMCSPQRRISDCDC